MRRKMGKGDRVLCIGSSFSAIPVLFVLKKYGFEVAVCGNQMNDPCHQYADESFYIDYSNKDELYKLVEQEKFKYIIPTCNDYSYISASYVANKLGYPGFDSDSTVQIIHTKDAFRKYTTENKIKAPRFCKFNSSDGVECLYSINLDYPLIVKPANVFSGRGVSKVNNRNDLNEALKFAYANSFSENIVVEEFKNGTLHSHSAFIKNGKIFTEFFVDEFCTVYPYQVNCSNHPSCLNEDARRNVRGNIIKMISSLHLADGLLHTQFIYDGDAKEIWIIESMRRAPGDLYGKLIERSTGFDYFDAYVRPFIEKELLTDFKVGSEKYYGRHTVSVAENSSCFSFVNKIPGKNMETVMLKNSGMPVEAAPYDKLAIIFSEFDSADLMLRTVPFLESYIQINTVDN